MKCKKCKTFNVAYITSNSDGQTFILRVNYSLDFTNTTGHSIL